jgi:UDP-3-O-[3-hydroxymyristoyl] glucosamine N-acyltransferase
VIGHDSLIKDHTWISAGAVIGGNSSVGEKSFIGLNATIGNNVVVGDSCLIGARTLITKALYQESVVVDRDSEILRLTSKQFIKITKLK